MGRSKSLEFYVIRYRSQEQEALHGEIGAKASDPVGIELPEDSCLAPSAETEGVGRAKAQTRTEAAPVSWTVT